jgi:AAA domain
MLPATPIEPVITYPSTMLITGFSGAGKSTLVQKLNINGYKCLHIDLQGGTEHIGGYRIDLQEEALKLKTNLYGAFISLIKDLDEAKLKGVQYDFVVWDTLSDFKELIIQISSAIYNNSMVGKAAAKKLADAKFGTNHTPAQLASCLSKDPTMDLGQNGWNFHNQAFDFIQKRLFKHAKYCTIILAHAKLKAQRKAEDSPEFNIKEIDFWPTYVANLVRLVSESGQLIRKDNEVYLNFVFAEGQAHFKSRYLDGQSILMSEMDDKKVITAHWEKIFPFLTTPAK